MDWLDLLVVQGTLKSLLHSSKATILPRSDFFLNFQLSHQRSNREPRQSCRQSSPQTPPSSPGIRRRRERLPRAGALDNRQTDKAPVPPRCGENPSARRNRQDPAQKKTAALRRPELRSGPGAGRSPAGARTPSPSDRTQPDATPVVTGAAVPPQTGIGPGPCLHRQAQARCAAPAASLALPSGPGARGRRVPVSLNAAEH